MSEMKMTYDATEWNKKIATLSKQNNKLVPDLVLWGADELREEIDKWLKGPHYGIGNRGPGTGKVPIPRQSGDLSNSVVSVKSRDKKTIEIKSLGSKAPYNIFVHGGTMYTHHLSGKPIVMLPRPFIGGPVKIKTPVIHRRFDKEIRDNFRKYGL